MKIARKTIMLLVAAAAAVFLYAPYIDRYDPSGSVRVSQLKAPVRIVRDENGIPYVFAETFNEAILGQGFVTAQDRLFQMELYRKTAFGKLSELIGEGGLEMDKKIHLWNIRAVAKRQVELLNDEERAFYQAYVDGVNSYISQRSDELPRGLTQPAPWSLNDIITIQIFQYFGSSTNWREELLSQSLIDHLGLDLAADISQITVNPDDEPGNRSASDYAYSNLGLEVSANFTQDFPAPDASGSNAWVTGPGKSVKGLPIVSSDPHLDSRRLPGIWYPMGMVTPKFRVVGASMPGGPGIAIGRSNNIAWGVTNGYGDVVDLYVEQLDPDREGFYLEGSKSLPFKHREEIIRIKDDAVAGGFREYTMQIRETRRGPIISDHGMTVAEGKLISLRWAIPEFINDRTGMRDLLIAEDVSQALKAIGRQGAPLTYVVADHAGNIARKGAGFIPRRIRGDGAAPLVVVDSSDSWDGRIPEEDMPVLLNPATGWVGSSNHRILDADYPYAYSTHFAHSWRYRRLKEKMAALDVWSTEDHWRLQLDAKNMLAERLAPLMAAALLDDKQTKVLAELLQSWDFQDSQQEAAPLVFQSLLRHYARRVVQDELGEELAAQYLNDYYYWHERIADITMANSSAWLDDKSTAELETREDLFRLAGHDALSELTSQYGPDPSAWRWGDAHTITFKHPLIPGKWAADWLGGGTHPVSGSGETLNRAAYTNGKPYETTYFSSMRFVADLSDPDKVVAHIPGGATERLFNPHMKNQLPAWLDGRPQYWWFSDAAIEQHIQSELRLTP